MKSKLAWVVVGICVLIGSPVSPGSSPPLADRVDAVVIKGKDLPANLRSAPIKSYRLFADQGQGLAVIPMQIEERNAKGEILVTSGPHPDKTDGNFDAGDELVFMARDAGLQPKAGPPTGCEKSALLTITDPKTKAVGYALLAQCSQPPPLSPKDYVKLSTSPHTAITERYRFGWHQALKFFYDYITINNGPDILDRLRVRATVGKFGVNYTFHEDQFKYTFLGYNDGPVRVSWKAANYWSLGPLGKLDVPQTIYFYSEYCILKNKIDLSMNPALIGLDMTVEIGHDMTIGMDRGYSSCTNALPECLALNKKYPEGSMKKYTDQKAVWGGTTGPEGALIIRVVVDPRLAIPVIGKFTFDPDFSDPPEYVKGMMPRISFYFPDWKKAKAETYDLDFYDYFMNKFSVPEYERYDRMVTAPLKLSVK